MVSVIVPAYKVEDYLGRCIESIRNQTYKNLEIILVDDGSPDRCGEICDNYQKMDQRIKVIHKKNGGLSDARNKGLDWATGEYILLVDGDDYIHPKMIEILLNNLKRTEADLAVCFFRQVESNERISEELSEFSSIVFEGEEIMNNLQYRNLCTVVAWNKLYKRCLFEELRYPVGKIHEDEFLTHRILHLCRKVVYIEEELYYYVQRAGSIMTTTRWTDVKDGWDAYEDRLKFLLENGYKQMELWTKFQMLHYICKFYKKLEKQPKTTEFLRHLRERFFTLFNDKEVQQELPEEQLEMYKYFVIKPRLYYSKVKQKTHVERIKQILKNIVH